MVRRPAKEVSQSETPDGPTFTRGGPSLFSRQSKRVTRPVRGLARSLVGVVCDCGGHFFFWRERCFRAHSDVEAEILSDASVPLRCRRLFGHSRPY